MLFRKENFEENRYMSFIMVQKKRQRPSLFINEAGHLTEKLSTLMYSHEINFGLDNLEYKDFGYMLTRAGRLTLYSNFKYSRRDRLATLNLLEKIDNKVVLESHNFFKRNDELDRLSKKYKNNNEVKYSLRRFNRSILFDYQEGYCGDCGKKYSKLELHHKLPVSCYGSNSILNAVLLCGESSGREVADCHQNWDELALGEGHIIFPGFPGNLLPNCFFRDKKRRQKFKSRNIGRSHLKKTILSFNSKRAYCDSMDSLQN
jgi:5-methylcytosine-specific restriction endonuclease McrA